MNEIAEASLEVQVAVLSNDVGYIKKAIDAVSRKIDVLGEAGLPRRVAELEAHGCDQDKAIEALQNDQRDFKAEIRGAIRVVKIVGLVVGFVGTVASLLLAAQALGVIR